MASIKRIKTLSASLAHAGHGPAIQNVNELIDQNLGFIEKRKAEVIDHLNGSANTPYELAVAVFGQRSHMEIFLALSETVAYLVFFQNKGMISIDWDSDSITLSQ
jgi:hypothetical protein